MNQVIAYTEKIVRTAIEDIPDGVYSGEDYADTDGYSDEPVAIKVTLTISESDITIDFAGSAPITKGAINSPMANTASAAFYSLQFFLAPHAPSNYGMLLPLELKLPDVLAECQMAGAGRRLHDPHIIQDNQRHLAGSRQGDPGARNRLDICRVQLVRRGDAGSGRQHGCFFGSSRRRVGRHALWRRHERDHGPAW